MFIPPLLAAVGTAVGAAGAAAATGVAGLAAAATSIAPIAQLGLGLAGAGISAMGAARSAEAASQEAQYKAAVARNNATAAEYAAEYDSKKGVIDAQAKAIQDRQIIGKQIAGFSSSGFDLTGGSPLDVLASQTQLNTTDSMRSGADTENKIWQDRTRKTNYLSDAGAADATATNAKTAGTINIASSLIGGASSFSDKWMTYKRIGAL